MSGKRFLGVLVVLIGCGADAGSAGADAAADSVVRDTVDNAVGDSVVASHGIPQDVLVRGGACPFECCGYTEWRADSAIAVQAEPRVGDDVSFRIPAREWFDADTGFVRITQPGIVVVQDSVRVEVAGGRARVLVAGDTVRVLDYEGEGFWNMWHEGAVVANVEQFWGGGGSMSRGRVLQEPLREWWVHARLRDGRTGWFLADSASFSGADGCGGPVER